MIASRIYYFIVCDNCDRRADYGCRPEAWRNPDLAINQLPSFWTSDGQRHHCPDCPQLAEENWQEVPC